MKYMTIFLILLLSMNFVYAEISGDTNEVQMLKVSLINQDPDPAIAGDVLEIRLGVENLGGEAAKNVVLELVPDFPFQIVNKGEQNIGTIDGYQEGSNQKIVKFELKVDKDATAGSYDLKVRRYFTDSLEYYVQTTLDVEIKSRESAEVIYIDQVELIPGKITSLTFTINNVGNAPLRDLSFQWENEDDIVLPVGSDNTKYVKYIEVGDSADLNFDVIASATADPDLYKLDLTLTYDDPLSGLQKELTTKAGIYVGGATDFDVAFSGSSGTESSFSVSNIGSVSASSVTVRIPDQKGWRVSGSNSVIIGNLNEGDYTIASFNLQKSGSMPIVSDDNKLERDTENSQRTIPEDPKVNIEIIYTDSRGNRNTIIKTVPVDSSNQLSFMSTDERAAIAGRMRGGQQSALQQIWSSGKWFIIGSVVLVLFLIVRNKRNKGRLKNPKYSYKDAVKGLIKQ